MGTPYHGSVPMIFSRSSACLSPLFVCPYLGHSFHGQYEYLSVADLTGAPALADGRYDRIHVLVLYHELELDLRDRVDFDFLSPVFKDNALLLSSAPDLDDGHGNKALICKGFFYHLQLFRPNNCLYHFHAVTSILRPLSMLRDIKADVLFFLFHSQADRQVNGLSKNKCDDERI